MQADTFQINVPLEKEKCPRVTIFKKSKYFINVQLEQKALINMMS